ncbi:MAG: radical SAM family heme chaperone HemW [Pyrinomonadaceae bacterium]|nr:radical SAM family heme chaperone HemW [Sphingobacteriaceae bacterium]
MAGVYLHIPFCKKACHYCDFHFTTSFKYKNELLQAMHAEIELQKQVLNDQIIETIYFGGGTPSLIGAREIQTLIDRIKQNFKVKSDAEITLEANPDDLDLTSVTLLKETDVNRLSIGIQSFFEEDLRWMNRAHNAEEAESAVKRVQDAGFENITVDLIYGYPLLSDLKWKSNIQKVINMNISHISAYSITVEPQTALASFIKKGKQQMMNESQSAKQYLMLIEFLKEAGFEHYETSNFAKPSCYSQHNTNYWKGINYLGIGPSAHSFNGNSRYWNISNNSAYIKEIDKGLVPATTEILTREDKVNEYIMTSLRTMWGMDLTKILSDFGPAILEEIENSLKKNLDMRSIFIENNTVKLTSKGKLFADQIASDLFILPNNS